MDSRILLLACAAAVCAAGMAAMEVLSRTPHKGYNVQAVSIAKVAPLRSDRDEVCRTDERVTAVNEALSRMKKNSRDAVSTRILSDTGDFLVALDGALAGDNGAKNGDMPLLSLIDKEHSVSSSYVPRSLIPLDGAGSYTVSRKGLSLRPEAAEALENMARAARKDGVTLMASSTYRSYDYQKTVYEKWVKIDGQEEADRESARPGTSQHQLGAAVDFGSITDDFDQTRAGRWMYAHAADWGWSLSFPKGYEDVTGYRWECWHFRYIGREAVRLQDEWFGGVQQYMMEFIDIYRSLIGSEGKSGLLSSGAYRNTKQPHQSPIEEGTV